MTRVREGIQRLAVGGTLVWIATILTGTEQHAFGWVAVVVAVATVQALAVKPERPAPSLDAG